MFGGLMTALGCARRPEPIDPESEKSPWDSAENAARAKAEPPPLHNTDDGVAMSWNGTAFAAALAGRPVNELAVVDLHARTARVLAAENYRVMLAQPAFSPDGKTLALVRTPPSYFGIGEILLTNLETFDSRVISKPGYSYRHPTFSPDGRRLAYFRNVNDPPPPGYMRPEYRNYNAWALFERDLATGTEVQLDPQPFGSAAEVFYDHLGRGLYFQAMDPLVQKTGARGLYWTVPDWSSDYEREIAFGRTFFLLKGQPLGQRPTPYAPADNPLTKAANLGGATVNGEVLLRQGRRNPEAPDLMQGIGVFFDGERVVSLFAPPGEGVQRLACSADGRTVGGIHEGVDARDSLTFDLVIKFPAHDEVEQFGLDELSWDRRGPFTLAAGG